MEVMSTKKTSNVFKKDKRQTDLLEAYYAADNSILMLEADVRLYGEGTEQVNDSLPVMAHDATDTMTTITLKDWLDEVKPVCYLLMF